MIFWKALYKLRIRESNQLKTVSELYDFEIHQKTSKPDYQNQKNQNDGEEKNRLETQCRNFGIAASCGGDAGE